MIEDTIDVFDTWLLIDVVLILYAGKRSLYEIIVFCMTLFFCELLGSAVPQI